MLTKYIRLIDFFVMDTLVSMCLERANGIHMAIAHSSETKEIDEEFPLVVDDLNIDYKDREWKKGDLVEVKSRSLKERWFGGQVVGGVYTEGLNKWIDVEYLANDFPRRKCVKVYLPQQ